MPLPPVVALEIGTSKVVAMVGEIRENGRLTITGIGEHASKGVRKGEVVDLENAAICVRAALHAAEESGQVTIRQVHLALSGGHIQSQINRGSTRVQDPHKEITQDDIERVMELARAINLPPEREVLHTIFQRFCIDDQEYVTNPEGLEGTKLSLDMLALHGVRSRLHNAVKVVQKVPMDVQDVAFSGLCSALAVLNPWQKEVGALVLDIGGGTTDYVAYSGEALAEAGAIGVGGDHITNDIALAFNISIMQAESLKRESGSAIVSATDYSNRMTVPAEVGFQERSINLAALNTVINARADEIFAMVKSRLDHSGIMRRIGAGVILTGGGAYLKGIVEMGEEVFGLPCSIGKPRDVDGLAAATEGPEYAVPVGMVRYGFKSDSRERFSVLAWLKGLFGRES